jgi:hypothetical protein
VLEIELGGVSFFVDLDGKVERLFREDEDGYQSKEDAGTGHENPRDDT